MIAAIADILKQRLDNLPWIERFAGLVTIAQRPQYLTGEGGAQILNGYQVYPVACGVNSADCWDKGLYKDLAPNSSKAAIAFFVDDVGCSLREVVGPRDYGLKFTFGLKFLCWMNANRMGEALTGGECNVSGLVVPYVAGQLFGHHSAAQAFGGGIQQEIFKAVEVNSVRQLAKSPTMFQPFTFANDPAMTALFYSPYDYFGLSIQGSFIINRNCLPSLMFSINDETCIDAHGVVPDFIPEGARITEGKKYLKTEDGKYVISE